MFVTAGLDLDGGGRAAAGRLLAASCAAFADERGLGWSVLSLDGLGGVCGGDRQARGFGGDRRALALAVWRRQLGGRRTACVYDLLGPARMQGWLPAPLRAPYLVILYGIEVWRPLGRARRRALCQATLRLAISAHTRDAALQANGDVGPIDVLPLCLEERAPAGAVDAELLERAGAGYVLIVGRMASTERYKGHDLLLDALRALTGGDGLCQPPNDATAGSLGSLATPGTPGTPEIPEIPGTPGNIASDAGGAGGGYGGRPLLVIAGDGDDRPRLETRAREMGLDGRVLFTGFVSEATLAELYRRAAVFAMPSLGEGFGLVYLEAMRAGKPCVAARGTAAAEIVVDGETGLLVDAAAPGELAAALARLLAERETARSLGEAGRRRFEQVFTPRRFRERLWPFLERLTA